MNAQNEGRNEVVRGTISIDGKFAIGKINDDFVYATLEWWPPEKCDYSICSWGLASLLNQVFFVIYLFSFKVIVMCFYNAS